MTQRDALEAKLELVETKKEQLAAPAAIYRDPGGCRGCTLNKGR